MRRRTQLITVGALMLGTATLVATVGVATAGAQGEPIHVIVPWDGRGFVLVDLDHDGRIDQAGRSSGRARVEDAVTGERIGSVLVDCVATTRVVIEERKGTWVRTLVFKLLDGHIIVQGEDPAGVSTSLFAVTGGTGLYRDARGEAEGVDAAVGDSFTSEFTIHLEP